MRKIALALTFLLGITTCALAQTEIDTLYYSKDWKRVPSKDLAEFYRFAHYPTESSAPKQFKDYYISGELQCEGYFISIDATDDAKSIFAGDCINYFKNGKPSFVRSYQNGLLNGPFTVYKENGLIETNGTYCNGELSGVLTKFSDDQTFIQIEYKDGAPINDYYVKGDMSGNLTRYRLKDNQPIWDSPTIAERKTEYKDDIPWQIYFKNGLSIALTNRTVNDYGRWHRLDIIISNNTMQPIVFQPEKNITAQSQNAKGETSELEVWSAERYIRKVNRTQIFAAVMMGIAEGVASAGAGYSRSVSHTHYSGHGPRGHYSGHATTYRRSYNAAAAYQAMIISQHRMIDFTNALSLEQEIKKFGYLKTSTIHPGESISGYVHVKRIKGETVQFALNINGAEYLFDWYFGKKRNK